MRSLAAAFSFSFMRALTARVRARLDIQEAVDEFAGVPEEMRDLALKLADLMRRLAEAARQGDKVGMIEITKEISVVVKQIMAFAKPYAVNCTDATLADTIHVGNNALGNFSTQLKILSAVKAASQGRDPTAESQLVACCGASRSRTRARAHAVASAPTHRRSADGIANGMRQALYGVASAKLKR